MLAPVFREEDYVPRCPKCGDPMQQVYSQRSLRRLALCVTCFIVEEWRIALLRR